VVQGKSLEAALDKGAVLLHCPKERIAYEILQEPRPGRGGDPPVLCKLRVTPVALAAEEMEGEAAPKAVEERLPWPEWDLAVMPSSVFLLSLQNLMTLIPRVPQFPEPAPLPDEHPEPRREVIGDVTGGDPIRHDGDVRVYGSVRKGARIEAAGGIHVVGDVETAFLDAGGDILITGGLLGTARSRCGSVACKFAQGARLDARRGDVTIQESSMHSHLRAGRSVFVGEILLGGTAYAEVLLEARTAGSPSLVPTVLMAGRNRRLMEEVEEIRTKAAQLVSEMRGEEAVCRELMPSEEAGVPLPVEGRLRLWRALMAKTRISDTLTQMSRQKSRLLGMINADRSARVSVTDRAYPNVKVTVDDLTMDLKNLTQFVTFSKDYEGGELRVTPYR
jgi:uncharacterized protein (DUF342 family)